MLEIINIHLPLEAGLPNTEDIQLACLCKQSGIPSHKIRSFTLKKRAIDARKKNNLNFVASFLVDLKSDQDHYAKACPNARQAQVNVYQPQALSAQAARFLAHDLGDLKTGRPLVVGAGCAGLFCALTLAQAGAQPLLVEQGERSYQRCKDIENFNISGQLKTNSNIQFGLGGAGTFSDGKLTTNTSSPYHRYILERFVQAGAPEEILYLSKPHIGSDLLPDIVENLVQMIESFGGEVRFRTKLTELEAVRGREFGTRACLLNLESSLMEEIHASKTILASGHSARELFYHLYDRGVLLERKMFSMGVRIEHHQSSIDTAQYGTFAGHPALGPADYKLVEHLKSGRSAYTFCMCPGGSVVAAASEKGMLCTNGMSEFARNKPNANAGYLVAVHPQDIKGTHPLAGIELQRHYEKAAYQAGGGAYKAPAQLMEDFLSKRPSQEARSIQATYPRGVTYGSLEGCLPEFILESLRQAARPLSKKLQCFADKDAVLTGVETRSSSPVRIKRDKNTCFSCSHPALIPCGEGAGYAGGIMSAAADGVRCAEAFLKSLG